MTAARWTVATLVTAALAGDASPQLPAAPSLEVRQLVTFQFRPGQLPAALEIYATHLVPIYREVEAMRHVRVFGEVESPEPLDLMVVTHYADLAAMDRANQDLQRPSNDHPPIAELYRQISALSTGHHDQFVEVISPPSFAAVPDGSLEVLEFLRVESGLRSPAFERQVLDTVHQWEEQHEVRGLIPRSETARMLLADGWDYLRTYSVRNLGAWQAYVTARARQPAAVALLNVSARKTMILREITALRVR